MNWIFITAAYPPDQGGVADYTVQLSESLADRGDRVWIFAGSGPMEQSANLRITVERLQSHFGVRALVRLSRAIAEIPAPRRIVLQYVPQAFGPITQTRRFRGLPLTLCLWLQLRRERVWTMFHEIVAVPGPNPSLPVRLMTAVTRWMVRLTVRKSDRIMVTVPAWTDVIREITGRDHETEWLPVPANLPVVVDSSRVAAIRMRSLGKTATNLIGHFGTYNPAISGVLLPLVKRLLRGRPERKLLLIGQGSDGFADRCKAKWPDLAAQIAGTGELPDQEASEHISACDLMVEPYPDGISTRRSSTMAPLALGVPIVTNAGRWTEPIWRESGAVALADKPDPDLIAALVEEVLFLRPALGEQAAKLYEDRFALSHTVDAMTLDNRREKATIHAVTTPATVWRS